MIICFFLILSRPSTHLVLLHKCCQVSIFFCFWFTFINTMFSSPLTLLALFLCKDNIRLHLSASLWVFIFYTSPTIDINQKFAILIEKRNIHIKWLLCICKPEKHFSHLGTSDQNLRSSAATLFRITPQSSNKRQPKAIEKYHCRGFFVIENLFSPVCIINYCDTESAYLNIK